jgi:hypothetical protein
MLSARYTVTNKNLSKILDAIVKGTAPPKFTVGHLEGLGFKSTNDRAAIPILKDIGLLTEDGTPTPRYHQYRGNPKPVLGEALREAYEDIFHVTEHPTDGDKAAIEGKFKTVHGVSDVVADRQAATFLTLLKHADLNALPKAVEEKNKKEITPEEPAKLLAKIPPSLSLRYNIEIHLPPTKDIEVYRAIFKAVREHLAE